MQELLIRHTNAFCLGFSSRVPEQAPLHVVLALKCGLKVFLEGLGLLDEGGSGCLVGVESTENVDSSGVDDRNVGFEADMLLLCKLYSGDLVGWSSA